MMAHYVIATTWPSVSLTGLLLGFLITFIWLNVRGRRD